MRMGSVGSDGYSNYCIITFKVFLALYPVEKRQNNVHIVCQLVR